MAVPSGLAKPRRALTKLWLAWRLPLVLVVVAAALVAGGWYGYTRYRASAARAAHERLKKEADAYVAVVVKRLRATLAPIDKLADTRKAAKLLSGGDAGAIAAYLSSLQSANPLIRRAWLLPAGYDKVDYASSPPLDYATLYLMRRAEKTGKPVPVEVHLLHTKRRHLAAGWPVPGTDGKPAGTLVFALPFSFVPKAVEAAKPPPGSYVDLQQVIPGVRPLTLVKLGPASLLGGQALVMQRIPGTSWRLRLWSAAQAGGAATGGAAGGLPMPLLIAIVAVVLLLAAFAVRARKTGGKRAAAAVTAEPESIEERGRKLERKLAALGGGEGTREPTPAPAQATPSAAVADTGTRKLPDPSIFRAYDIRGVVGQTLDADVARSLGRAIGSEAYQRGRQTIAVGRDGRLSSPELGDALIEGLRASGRDVIDVGRVPTPVLYFATYFLETGSGVMVTGSHNPAEYNGFKIMLGEETLHDEAIKALRGRLESGALESGEGTLQQVDVSADYIRRITEEVPVALGSALKIVVDAGNGVAGDVAPKLLRALGHDVVELYCEVDGRFPHHHPDPTVPKNLADLVRTVKENGADIGFAFDGDGDRLAVVDGRGRVLWPDRQMMLYARDVLSRNAGATIVYDVKCTSRLGRVIRKLGGKPVMWKTGHSLIKAKMRETGALLAGEMSGHIFFKERWYGFDDAIYTAARMIEILMGIGLPPADVFKKLPTGFATPELRVDLEEGEHQRFMQELLQGERFPGASTSTIDGLRVDYPDGWGLVRASNTTPSLVLRFEADSKDALARIQGEFKQALLEVDAGLSLPF